MRTLATLVASALLALSAWGAEDPKCKASGPLPGSAIFIGYSRPDESQLNSLGLLVSNRLTHYDGRNLHEGLALRQAASAVAAETTVASVKPYLERMGKNHCEFPAELSASPTKAWRIWVSDSSVTLRPPSLAEQASFRKLRPDCTSQGDYPRGQEVCAYADLLAVSDLDADGAPEYWHTTPYLWDTGLTVAELTTPTTLETVINACPGCSD